MGREDKGYQAAISRLGYECFLEQVKILQKGNLEVLRVLSNSPPATYAEESDFGSFMRDGAKIFQSIHETYEVSIQDIEQDLIRVIDSYHDRINLPTDRLNS